MITRYWTGFRQFCLIPVISALRAYDNGNLICLLARAAVNYPYPSMKAECVGLYEKRALSQKKLFSG